MITEPLIRNPWVALGLIVGVIVLACAIAEALEWRDARRNNWRSRRREVWDDRDRQAYFRNMERRR